jgi:DNA-binding NarL/FixJ family response regulator
MGEEDRFPDPGENLMSVNKLSTVKILIVDDMASVRQGLRTILQLAEDFEVVGEACDGLEAIRAVNHLNPEVVIMDLEMPVLGGLEATKRIKEQHPEIHIVIITIHGGDEVREQAARAGSDAFVEKEAPTEKLIEAIRKSRDTDSSASRNRRNEP